MPRRISDGQPHDGVGPAFAGFAPPTSNTTYCPNQFFDVCLPHYPRGVVRLVGFLIRKTLGWCDAQGNPQAEQHAVSYADLEKAGVSRDMIRSAIEQAIRGHFIRCVRKPLAKKAGQASASGRYELQWDERGQYLKDPSLFRGFFAGEGNRTYIPNQFFDDLVPRESLAVLKVVGSVVRFSIGYANKWGHRRRHVALSFQHLQNYARLKDRKTLSDAVKHALKSRYIERVEAGYFDPDGGKQSRAAIYALQWLNPAAEGAVGQKTPPAEMAAKDRSENPTGIGRKSLPADRSENPTGIEIKQGNKTYKQQHADADLAATFQRLRREGFDERAAKAIASSYPAERVERQVRWLDRRTIKCNRLGMLRAAIEQDWPLPGRGGPGRGQLGRPNREPDPVRPAGLTFADAIERAKEKLTIKANLNTP